ncbi:STAS domain-containing protein [Thermincola potens]|uniref:Anti-sigma factor antagonist n=1 Tax=Thermincola potens (strain JR) TaxID=635013 RepID=D5X7Y3_THEPJ|nr:STAS domain-containing protein [Thermincola potens]ADG82703.1 anti-sigma-factor antagonist [Thermincola potens JR]
MLELQTIVKGTDRMIELIGELDIATVDKFKTSVEEARQGATALILNMEKLSFVDSTGVGGLLNVIKSLKNDNIDVKIRNLSAEVYEVFDLLGLPMLLGREVFEQRE